MIALTTESGHRCRCPNCGGTHWCPETAFSDAYSWTVTLPAPKKPDLKLLQWKVAYDAEKESRRLALGRLPKRFPPTQVRQPNVQHMVHRQRCPARRPCMTLLQRVLQGKR